MIRVSTNVCKSKKSKIYCNTFQVGVVPNSNDLKFPLLPLLRMYLQFLNLQVAKLTKHIVLFINPNSF